MTISDGKLTLSLKDWGRLVFCVVVHTVVVLTWFESRMSKVVELTTDNRVRIAEIESRGYTSVDAKLDQDKFTERFDRLFAGLNELKVNVPILSREIEDVSRRLQRIEVSLDPRK